MNAFVVALTLLLGQRPVKTRVVPGSTISNPVGAGSGHLAGFRNSNLAGAGSRFGRTCSGMTEQYAR